MRVVMADQTGGRLPMRSGSLEMSTEVREVSEDQEAGSTPVMPVLLMSRDCSLRRWVQVEGRLPTAFKSPPNLRCVNNVRADQEAGRLPS